ncbi:G8 domain-containing protein [Microbacterium oryzae]|uniref:G8 domain-containing protein n=1 Tax=Microbacterium oryzae TaxID=743009 RepID=UPI0025AEFC47|nr:G8 domain-containing protein [Microbacterium oryzae]MDN3310119.1 G8 domain-containing protein [Microbacterium oryzae]
MPFSMTAVPRRRVFFTGGTALAVSALAAGLLAFGPSSAATSSAATSAAADPSDMASPGCDGALPWGAASTWSDGAVPGEGADVTLPAGAAVSVDVDVPHLGRVEVPGDAALCFPDRDAVFSAREIIVHGELQAGTAERPLMSELTIKLEGGTPEDDYELTGHAAHAIEEYTGSHQGHCTGSGDCLHVGPSAGTNLLLAANGGSIELHGQDVGRTWTELAATAEAGATTLELDEAVSWRVGDEIVVASSSVDWREAESARVEEVSGDGRIVRLDAPLEHSHSSIETCETADGETRCVAERAEVGLLTHNVKVAGPDEPVDGFGGQIMIAAGGRIDTAYTELVRLGQKGLIGHYPIHFHVTGAGGADSEVADISMHDSFNRQVTIHGTDGVRVSRTVSYLTFGHSFMLEDGFETGNQLSDNLVIGSRFEPDPEQRVRESDRTPSGFWIPNADNDLRGNHVAGGDGTGIWIDFGTDNHNVNEARRGVFGVFDDNVAHSNDAAEADRPAHEAGNGIFVGGYVGSPPERAEALRNSAWKNTGTGLWIDGPIDFVDSTAANNHMGATLQGSVMRGGLLMGETENAAADPASSFLFPYGAGVLRAYHGASDYDDVWVGGFGGTPITENYSAISDGGAGISDHPMRIKNLRFFGEGYRVLFDACPFEEDGGTVWGQCYWGPEHGGNAHALVDLDGSIREDGQPVTYTNSAPFLRHGDDFLYPQGGETPFGPTARGLITSSEHRYIEFTPRDPAEGLTLTRESDGATTTDAGWNMIELGERYRVDGPLRMFNVGGNYAGEVEFVVELDAPPSEVARGSALDGGDRVAQEEASSLEALGEDGAWWWEDGELYLHVEIGGEDVPFGRAGDETTLDHREGPVWSIVP